MPVSNNPGTATMNGSGKILYWLIGLLAPSLLGVIIGWASTINATLHSHGERLAVQESQTRDVRDELKEGQQILVKCIGKEGNKIKLSSKAVLHDENRNAEAAANQD